MNRFVHSRALICIVAVLLQVAWIPGVRCMARAGSLACCCARVVDAEAAADRSCCAHDRGATQTEDSSDDDERSCSCDADAPDVALVSGDSDEKSKAGSVAAELPGPTPTLARLCASKRAELRPIPRARTGPPLFVLHQVWLI